MKRTIVIVAMAAMLLIGSATVALAADGWKTPAQIVSDLTDKTEEQVLADRQAGSSYGAQATASGKLDEFKTERLAQYKLCLDEAVKDKKLTQAEADKLYAAMKDRMQDCTGGGAGAGCGGMGQGRGAGAGCGLGRGMGMGRK